MSWREDASSHALLQSLNCKACFAETLLLSVTETWLTSDGLEVFCSRCQKSVMHITPRELAALLVAPPECAGRHSDHAPS